MRILIISPTYPVPPDNGAKRRILAFANCLSRHHDVTMVALQDHANVDSDHNHSENFSWNSFTVRTKFNRWRAAISSLLSNIPYRTAKFWNIELKDIVTNLLHEVSFDIVFVNFVASSPYLQEWLDNRPQPTQKPILVLDQHNVDETEWQSHLSVTSNLAYKLFTHFQMWRIKQFQSQWYPKYDAILSVSETDIAVTQQYVTTSNTMTWLAPNGVDIQYFTPDHLRSNRKQLTLTYVGSMDVRMNQDAVQWFVQNILPNLRARFENLRFLIVGRNPPEFIRRLSIDPAIEVTGRVSDVRSQYARSTVFVIPARIGGGTKLKTLEAMAMGLPIVSTSVGAQGLDVIDGRHLYIADKPGAFTTRVTELLDHQARALTMGHAARNLAVQKYGWNTIVKNIENRLTHLLESKR